MADETREKRPYTRRTTEEKQEKTFTEADVRRMVAEAVAKAMASVPQAQPQTVVINNTKEEMVTLLYMGAVAEDSTHSNSISLAKPCWVFIGYSFSPMRYTPPVTFPTNGKRIGA